MVAEWPKIADERSYYREEVSVSVQTIGNAVQYSLYIWPDRSPLIVQEKFTIYNNNLCSSDCSSLQPEPKKERQPLLFAKTPRTLRRTVSSPKSSLFLSLLWNAPRDPEGALDLAIGALSTLMRPRHSGSKRARWFSRLAGGRWRCGSTHPRPQRWGSHVLVEHAFDPKPIAERLQPFEKWLVDVGGFFQLPRRQRGDSSPLVWNSFAVRWWLYMTRTPL